MILAFITYTIFTLKKNQNTISVAGFRFMKFVIFLGDVVFEAIVTSIFIYMVYYLDYETPTGFAINVVTTLVNFYAAYNEIQLATRLE